MKNENKDPLDVLRYMEMYPQKPSRWRWFWLKPKKKDWLLILFIVAVMVAAQILHLITCT